MTQASAIEGQLRERLDRTALFVRRGRVSEASGAIIRASGTHSIGEVCQVTRTDMPPLLAEVVGFQGGHALMTPYGPLDGISGQSQIHSVSATHEVPVGDALRGRVVDGLGAPLDGKPPIDVTQTYPSLALAPDPMERPVIDTVFPTGIRAIDATLTCGVGQRFGIFAAAGGGKSTLLSMLVRFAAYDRCVVALIGERGREVREFVDLQLGPEGLAKSVLVVATSDRPAIEQVKAAYTATAIAEYYRDQGERVLLLMDSLTRFARAQRQIGLSAGEPPTRRGFPPSVFEKLPCLVERPGLTVRGSITAFYTVLVEGDDMTEPVADETRSLLDGHIVLSRKLAEAGHYPAIDVQASTSRVFTALASAEQKAAAAKLRALLTKFDEIELLVRIGEYATGSDRMGDEAIARRAALMAFLQQDGATPCAFEDTQHALIDAVMA